MTLRNATPLGRRINVTVHSWENRTILVELLVEYNFLVEKYSYLLVQKFIFIWWRNATFSGECNSVREEMQLFLGGVMKL